MEQYLMLKATEHNWGLSRQGDWSTVTWRIYSDGTYTIRTSFIPVRDDLKESPHKMKYKTVSGKMEAKAFAELKTLLKRKQWRDPSIQSGGCDGVAWEIKYYSKDKILLNSSGKLDYIYGHECLERIVSLLPETDETYDANAFIMIDRG